MNYNPTVKRYGRRDVGIMIPNVEFCPTDFPRLLAQPAPYLPLKLHEEKHDNYYVILAGKVVARDSMDFLVPAGLLLQLETFEAAVLDAAGGNLDVTALDLELYDQTDVDNGVINSRGLPAALSEPVVYSMITVDGNPLPNFVLADADAVAISNDPVARRVNIGNHIGVAFESMLRPSTDVISRAADDHLFNSGSASGMEALKGRVNAVDERVEAGAISNDLHTVRTDYCYIYPVVTSYAPLIEGQAVAVGESMAAFVNGARVTYDADSNIVVASPAAVVVGSLAGNDAADLAAVQAAIDAALVSAQKYHDRCVGQVIARHVRHPKSLLDKVKTRWDSTIPGFETLDRMPGSANGGYPWNMQTAGATLGEIVISTFMR